MSSPLIFDTGALVALFNKVEADIARKIENYIDPKPHSPRLVFEPNLVELFHWLVQRKKRMSPKDVGTNLDHYAIEIIPIPSDYSLEINKKYLSLDYKVVFDYADFYMCAAALRMENSEIITVDTDDLPNALAVAMKLFESGQKFTQLVPFSSK